MIYKFQYYYKIHDYANIHWCYTEREAITFFELLLSSGCKNFSVHTMEKQSKKK